MHLCLTSIRAFFYGPSDLDVCGLLGFPSGEFGPAESRIGAKLGVGFLRRDFFDRYVGLFWRLARNWPLSVTTQAHKPNFWTFWSRDRLYRYGRVATAFALVAALLYLAEIGHEQQDAINKRTRGEDKTAATKAVMAEATVAD